MPPRYCTCKHSWRQVGRHTQGRPKTEFERQASPPYDFTTDPTQKRRRWHSVQCLNRRRTAALLPDWCEWLPKIISVLRRVPCYGLELRRLLLRRPRPRPRLLGPRHPPLQIRHRFPLDMGHRCGFHNAGATWHNVQRSCLVRSNADRRARHTLYTSSTVEDRDQEHVV